MKFILPLFGLCLLGSQAMAGKLELPDFAPDAEQTSLLDEELHSKDNESFSLVGLEEVSSPALKILGKGIRSRQSLRALVIACVAELVPGYPNSDCRYIRHVMIDPDAKKAYYVGPKYYVSVYTNSVPSPLDKSLDSELKELNHKFRDYKHGKDQHRRAYWMAAIAVGGLVPATVVGFGIGAAIYGSAVGVSILLSASGNLFVTGTGDSNTSFLNTQGWNWSMDPHAISKRTFRLYFKFLNEEYCLSQAGLDEFADGPVDCL